MKPHTSERQAVLKRKREEAEDEARARLEKVQSEKDARAAKKRCVATGKKSNPPKKSKPPKNPRTGHKCGGAGVKSRDKAPIRPVVSSPGEAVDSEVNSKANHIPPPEALGASTENTGDATGTVAEDQVADRSQEVTKPLLATGHAEVHVIRLTSERSQWSEVAKEAADEIAELDLRIDDLEVEEQDTTKIRRERVLKRRHIKQAEEAIEEKEKEIFGLRQMQTAYNSMLYELPDFSRDNDHLKFLSDGFWQSSDEHRAATSAYKDLELELRQAEQEAEEEATQVVRFDKSNSKDVQNVSASAGASSPQAAVEDSQEKMKQDLAHHHESMLHQNELRDSLRQARGQLCGVASTLSRIVYDLLVSNNFLRVEGAVADAGEEDPDAVSSSTTQTQRNGDVDADRQPLPTNVPDEQARAEPTNEDEPANEDEPKTRVDRQPLPATSQETQAPAQLSTYEKLRAGQKSVPLTKAALATLNARVNSAKRKRELCRDEEAAGRNKIPSYAASWDEDRQGAARVRHMREKVLAVKEAEQDYRDVRYEAQGALEFGYTKSQTSNFRISASERAREERRTNPSSYEGDLTLPEPKRARMQDWAARANGDNEIAFAPDLKHDRKMNWSPMLEPGLAECMEETLMDRRQQHLNEDRQYRENLRGELQDHGQRDRPSGIADLGTESDAPKSNLHFDFAMDNHRSGVEEGALRPEAIKKIPLPEPAENDFHPKNRDAGIIPEISQPWGWADYGRPMMRGEDTPENEDDQQTSEENAGDAEDESDPRGPHNDRRPPADGSFHMPQYGSNDPLIDYAIDGYDGENMDGIE